MRAPPEKRRREQGSTLVELPEHRRRGRGFTLVELPEHRRGARGFTLVELMVVIVILGLLATIVALNVIPLGDQGKVQKAKSDIATIESALEIYKLQQLNYPSTTDGLQALVSPPASLTDPSRYQKGGYIKKLPKDPWGRDYLYASPGQHGAFDVWSYGADGKEGGEGPDADIVSWQ